ncbi:MAG: ABC transporter ATP-binding protein [Microbacteriaceae bacterium]|nr:ABC transporter ATP-binding protein [Microbacteriaceae bacterium]
MTSGAVPASAQRPFRLLARELRPRTGRLALAAVAFLVKDSPLWVIPVITAAVIDTVVQGGTTAQLLLLGGIAAALIALNYPVNQLWVRLFSSTMRDLGVSLRNRLTHRLQELSIGFHARSHSSVIQTKVVRDVENVETMLLQGANPALSGIGVATGAIIVLAVQTPGFLVLLALVVPIAVVLLHSVRARAQRGNEQFRRDVEQFSSRVGEMASLLPVTRAHGLEEHATERVLAGARSVRDSGFSLDVINGRFGALAWVSFQLLAVVCLVGAAWVSLTRLFPVTPGQVVLLSTYFIALTNSIVNLLNLIPLIAKGRESLRSIAEVLEEPDVERNEGKRVVPSVRGRLRFDGVGFRYPDAPQPAVDGLDLEVHPGETVAFVGPSGSGKSTALNLALGFLRPTSGRILIDDADIEELDMRSVRRWVSVVPQDSVLFTGTIRDNVTFGLGAVPEERIEDALSAANALELMTTLPEGLDTRLGERGGRISGGQRQRISIARALIRDPRILLLDEATSALDVESERLVQEALARLRAGRTTLVVAHRLSTIRSADRIVVLDRGRVDAIGTHEALLRTSAVYARLHALASG